MTLPVGLKNKVTTLRLILHRRKHQLDLSQIRYRVTQNERKVVLEVELNRGAEARALRKENQVLQLENALDNLIESILGLVDLHATAVLTDDRLLLREIAHTTED